MDMLTRLFQMQVRDQCRFVLLAADDLNDGMGQGTSPNADIQRVFFALQNLLSAAANISKALWGSSPKAAERRQALRGSLGVADDSPLRNRDLRNHFDHFDERLDKWDSLSRNHNYVDFLIGDRASMGGPGLSDVDVFRHYDPQRAVATFWGDEYNIQAIVTAAAELYERAATESDKPMFPPEPSGQNHRGIEEEPGDEDRE
jgi:hypothetical protein